MPAYTRTVQVPVARLTAKKAGMLNRAMKDYRRAREQTCRYFKRNNAFEFTYSERDELRKELGNHDRINLPSRVLYPAIATVEQNYKEYEKDGRASPPQANRTDTLALEGQNARIYHTEGRYYLNVSTGNGVVNLPLVVSNDDYHKERFPNPDTVPPAGRTRTGVQFADLEPEDFPGKTVKLSTSTLQKTGQRRFIANLVFQIEKRVDRPNDGTPRYLIGVDRGRNQLASAAVYDIEEDHVVDWWSRDGDEVQHYMDEFSNRIREFQQAGVWKQMEDARMRRFRYKEQADYEVANAIVNLARERLDAGIILEDLGGLSRLGSWKVENRRFAEWSYYRLEQYIQQKAEPYDIPVQTVEPAYTSRECSRCGTDDTARDGIYFECRECNYEQHADANAAVNIAKRAT